MYVRKDEEEKWFFVIYFGGGGVSVCVNADRTGQLAPPSFLTTTLQMSHI